MRARWNLGCNSESSFPSAADPFLFISLSWQFPHVITTSRLDTRTYTGQVTQEDSAFYTPGHCVCIPHLASLIADPYLPTLASPRQTTHRTRAHALAAAPNRNHEHALLPRLKRGKRHGDQPAGPSKHHPCHPEPTRARRCVDEPQSVQLAGHWRLVQQEGHDGQSAQEEFHRGGGGRVWA